MVIKFANQGVCGEIVDQSVTFHTTTDRSDKCEA